MRKYSLTPVDDSATPLKYSSVPEDQGGPTKVPPLSKLNLKDNPIPESKYPTMRPPEEPFQETTPNYSQLLPDHLRYNIDKMYMPRTSSKVGHRFSTSLEGSDSATSSFKGPPVPSRNNPGVNNDAKSPFESETERRPKPEQKYYSADDITKLLKQLRQRSNTQADVKLNDTTPHYNTRDQGDAPCKYCGGFNPSKYRGQYILETEPPPYRPVLNVTSPTYLGEGSPLIHTPKGKHYHIVEVNPQPYFTADDREPLHSYGNYNVLADTARPNLMEPDHSDEVIENQTTHRNTDTIKEGVQEPRPQNSLHAHSKHVPAFQPKQQPIIRNRNSTRLSPDNLLGSASLGQPLTHNDLKTRSLPYRNVPHNCYTIPEENVIWPPPFHHSRSFHQVNRGGFRK